MNIVHNRQEKYYNNNGRFKSMDMENTVSAFALVFAAAPIALILLFIEVIHI